MSVASSWGTVFLPSALVAIAQELSPEVRELLDLVHTITVEQQVRIRREIVYTAATIKYDLASLIGVLLLSEDATSYGLSEEEHHHLVALQKLWNPASLQLHLNLRHRLGPSQPDMHPITWNHDGVDYQGLGNVFINPSAAAVDPHQSPDELVLGNDTCQCPWHPMT